MPKKVLYSLCFSEFYGTQQSVLSTARSLDPENYIPIVAAPYGARLFDLLEKYGIEAVDVPFHSLYDIKSILKLKKIIAEKNIALIHAHLGISTFISIAAASRTRTPVVSTRHFINDRHTGISSPFLRSLYTTIYTRMNRRLSKTIYISEAVRAAVSQRESIPNTKGVVVYNGICVDNIPRKANHTQKTIDRIRSEFGIPADRFLVVCLSRLAPEKDVQTLVRAAAVLKADGIDDIYFVVAGTGALGKQLEQLRSELGVRDIIDFMGYVEDAAGLLSVADAFALCALEEPFGIAVLEALAAGVPVVAAAAGGPAEILEDDVSGLLFEPGNPKALADNLAVIINNPDKAAALVAAGRNRVADFDEKTIASLMQAVYDDVLSGGTTK